jgi:GNAT superfamily N-acetyltransferase
MGHAPGSWADRDPLSPHFAIHLSVSPAPRVEKSAQESGNEEPMFSIAPEDPASADSQPLMNELSSTLANITGNSGKASFDPDDVRVARACFVVARDAKQRAVGCGAFRPLRDGIAEVKRMYSRQGASGVGSAILAYLEAAAADFGYQTLWLETRLINARAVSFYERRGYRRIPNFGKYAGSLTAVCFEKRLSVSCTGVN